jgi:2-polyprenyl-3-methyl-5-hydroxy-6-metoxy-1,4-benzoquinol methylase
LNHLGGHLWKTHVDEGVIKYLHHCGYRSLIDVGCGPGGNVLMAREYGFTAIGIDGDPELQRLNPQNDPIIFKHDYTLGTLPNSIELFEFDVGLSTEFLEHVEERFIPNIMDTFRRCRIVICTHALPGETAGHHHVNLQTEAWWIAKFSEYGFNYSDIATENVRQASTMHKGFMKKTGKVFIRKALA